MNIYIGTSGWLYNDWVGKFYPEDLKDIDKLTFLSKHFSTVEINSTFYHMPPPKTFKRWHDVVDSKFRYSVKFSRYITRTKRLLLDDELHPALPARGQPGRGGDAVQPARVDVASRRRRRGSGPGGCS